MWTRGWRCGFVILLYASRSKRLYAGIPATTIVQTLYLPDIMCNRPTNNTMEFWHWPFGHESYLGWIPVYMHKFRQRRCQSGVKSTRSTHEKGRGGRETLQRATNVCSLCAKWHTFTSRLAVQANSEAPWSSSDHYQHHQHHRQHLRRDDHQHHYHHHHQYSQSS